VVKTELTLQDQYEYINGNTNLCPYCKSENIEGDLMQPDVAGATQKVTCLDCGHRWMDELTITGIIIEKEFTKGE